MKSDLQMKKAHGWTAEEHDEIKKIVDELIPQVERLHELAYKGCHRKRAADLRFTVLRIRKEIDEIPNILK